MKLFSVVLPEVGIPRCQLTLMEIVRTRSNEIFDITYTTIPSSASRLLLSSTIDTPGLFPSSRDPNLIIQNPFMNTHPQDP